MDRQEVALQMPALPPAIRQAPDIRFAEIQIRDHRRKRQERAVAAVIGQNQQVEVAVFRNAAQRFPPSAPFAAEISANQDLAAVGLKRRHCGIIKFAGVRHEQDLAAGLLQSSKMREHVTADFPALVVMREDRNSAGEDIFPCRRNPFVGDLPGRTQ